jgi:hypothetical protein
MSRMAATVSSISLALSPCRRFHIYIYISIYWPCLYCEGMSMWVRVDTADRSQFFDISPMGPNGFKWAQWAQVVPGPEWDPGPGGSGAQVRPAPKRARGPSGSRPCDFELQLKWDRGPSGAQANGLSDFSVVGFSSRGFTSLAQTAWTWPYIYIYVCIYIS